MDQGPTPEPTPTPLAPTPPRGGPPPLDPAGGAEPSGWGWAPPDQAADQPPRGPSPSRTGAPGVGEAPAGAVRIEAGPPGVPVPLRPLGLLDVLDGAFAVIKLRPRTVFTLTAVLVIPVQLVVAFGSRGQLGESLDFSAGATVDALGSDGGFGGWDVVLAYLALLPLPFLGAALARLIGGWYGGTDIGPAELLRGLLPQTPALLGSWILAKLIQTVALVACLAPVVFVMPFLLTLAPAIGVEGLGAIGGIRRSWTLGQRRYGSMLLVVVFSALLAGVLQFSFTVVPMAIASFVGPDLGWIVVAAGNAAAALIITPFVCAAAVLAYLDVRVRTEGLDLEVRAAEVLGRDGG